MLYVSIQRSINYKCDDIFISIFIGNTCYGLYRYATNVVDLSYYMNRKKLLINLLKYSYIDLTLDI